MFNSFRFSQIFSTKSTRDNSTKYTSALTTLPLDPKFWSTNRVENPDTNLSIQNHLGRKCLQVIINPGDRQEFNGNPKVTERTEIGEIQKIGIPLNTPMVYKFDVSFGNDFIFCDNRLVFAQWKHTNSNNRPIVSLRYKNGKLITAIINDKDINQIPHEVDLRKKWSTITVKLNLAIENGYVTTILDGKEIANFKGATALKNEEPKSFFKMGLYRDTLPYSDRIYFSNFSRQILTPNQS